MEPTTGQRRILIAVAIVAVAAQLVATGPLRDSWWGLHHYGFLPVGWLVGGLALLAALQALWSPRVASRLLGDPVGGSNLPRFVWPIVLACVGGVLLWLVRVRHLLLGDGSVIVVDVPRGGGFLPREPLTGWLQQRFYDLGQQLFGGAEFGQDLLVQESLALGSVVAGALFLVVAWFLAGEVAAGRDATSLRWRWPLFLLLAGQGYLLLFCGYVEHYALPTLAIALYLWLALRALRLGGTLLWPAAVLLLAVCTHLSTAVLGPSFLVLAASCLASRATRRRAWRDLLWAALLVFGVLALVAVLARGYNLLDTLADVTRQALTREQENDPGYMLSSRHWRDFLNNQALIGPFALLLFMPAAALALGRRRCGWRGWFLVVAGLVYFTVSWLAGESNLGYPRNWDLLAPGGLVFATAGLGLLLGGGASSSRSTGVLAALWIAVGVSWFHTVPWVALNTSFDRSFERFKTLPSAGGLTETNVGRWYLIRGEREEGRRWLQAALSENPRNNNAWFLVGRSYEDEDRFEDAAVAYQQAVALRPDKVGFREALVRVLVSANHWPEAVAVGAPLRDDASVGAEALGWYGAALEGGGDAAGAAPIWRRVRAATNPGDTSWRVAARAIQHAAGVQMEAEQWLEAASTFGRALEWDPDGRDAWLGWTYCLSEGGDVEDAEAVAREALARYPDWPEMLTNLGLLLHRSGRADEARSHLERSLELDPEQAQVRGLLGR